MSYWVFGGRHKEFKFQTTIGTGATGVNVAACFPQGEDRVSFTRFPLNACPPQAIPTGFEATIDTLEIGDTEHRPLISGFIPSSGLDAQIHTADSELTPNNRGIRARHDYYFWQGRDIWKYDHRIETSGLYDTFSQWTIDATPVTTLIEGQNLGLYPVLLGSGNLNFQAPYLCTVAFGQTNQVIRIRKNLITGIWESGQVATLSLIGGSRNVTNEVFHDNKVYFVTADDDAVGVFDFNSDTFTELPWPEEVRHPMDLNVFGGSVYCLNKTVSDNAVSIFRVDPVLGVTRALTLDSGVASSTNNFRGRNMLFTCTAPNIYTGNDPHMVAFNFVSNQVAPTGSGFPNPSGGDPSVTSSGTAVWFIANSGNNSELYKINTGKNPNLLADAWGMGSNGQMFRFPYEFTAEPNANKTEDMVYRPWVDDQDIVESGLENIWIVFRENPDDGAGGRLYRYRNTPQEDRMDFVFETHFFGGPHHMYSTPRFGGGHRDASWGKFDVVVSGVEDLTNGKSRVWFILDSNYLYDNGTPLKISIRYGGQAEALSTPHKTFASIDGATSGTIVNNELYINMNSGIPHYIDWDTIGEGLQHRGKINFIIHASCTGLGPNTGAIVNSQSAPTYYPINAEPFQYPTGPQAYGMFTNIAPIKASFSTGPHARGMITQDQISDFTFSTGPLVAGSGFPFTIAPASGVTIDTIWWGFRSAQRRISGFGRAQGI